MFVLGVTGYATGFSLVLAALAKFVSPHDVGAWVSPRGFSIGTLNDPAAHDVLGWWLVPVGLSVGALAVLGTTRLLRWTLRFARIRRPTGAAPPG
jgi:hypothetical protein